MFSKAIINEGNCAILVYESCLDGFLEASEQLERRANKLLDASGKVKDHPIKDGDVRAIREIIERLRIVLESLGHKKDTGLSSLLGNGKIKAGLSARPQDASYDQGTKRKPFISENGVTTNVLKTAMLPTNGTTVSQLPLSIGFRHRQLTGDSFGMQKETDMTSGAAGHASKSLTSLAKAGLAMHNGVSEAHIYLPSFPTANLVSDGASRGIGGGLSTNDLSSGGISDTSSVAGANKYAEMAKKMGYGTYSNSSSSNPVTPLARMSDHPPIIAEKDCPSVGLRMKDFTVCHRARKIYSDNDESGVFTQLMEPGHIVKGSQPDEPRSGSASTTGTVASQKADGVESYVKQSRTQEGGAKRTPSRVSATKDEPNDSILTQRDAISPQAGKVPTSAATPNRKRSARTSVTPSTSVHEIKTFDVVGRDVWQSNKDGKRKLVESNDDDKVETPKSVSEKSGQSSPTDAKPSRKRKVLKIKKEDIDIQPANAVTPKAESVIKAEVKAEVKADPVAEETKATKKSTKKATTQKPASKAKEKVDDAVMRDKDDEKEGESSLESSKKVNKRVTKSPMEKVADDYPRRKQKINGKRSLKSTLLMSYTGKRKDDIVERLTKAAIYYDRDHQFFDYLDDPKDEHITHLIAPDNMERPTLKVLYALCQGAYILKTDYLQAAERAEKWPDEVGFEHPRWPIKAKRPQASDVMKAIKINILEKGKKLSAVDVEKLACYCGAKVVDKIKEATHCLIPDGAQPLDIVAKHPIPDGATLVTENWFISVIEGMKMLPSDVPPAMVSKGKSKVPVKAPSKSSKNAKR
ncbi:hypothetical protein BgAZ_303310 [Babesia gibsoni]|uniref:BRCT domain-containing protein n=1 Tax=Babesia gibsoni TaxID=33632 RepID=A0AAD8LJY3_BABGI|nr:hypothetical protein BgAZ_303310 [Babesia gibsoni]